MKSSVLLLTFLLHILSQEACSTDHATCDCHQIGDLVNNTVQKAVADLEDRLETFVNATVKTHSLDMQNTKINTTTGNLIESIQQKLDDHLSLSISFLGSERNPAVSCKTLHMRHPQAPSGYYWVKQSGSAVNVYCSMHETCGGETGGWMRVANIDMRNTSQSCPSGLRLNTFFKRLCDTATLGCVSNMFSVQRLQYSKVCGKIIAYQKSVPAAFFYGFNGIDLPHVFGVSLTHGHSPREHIWTFAGASDESEHDIHYKCPCINSAVPQTLPFLSNLGNDYFCDTALEDHYTYYPRFLFTWDPLWDGNGCGPDSTCCSFNTPPWFVKELPSSTTDDIEMRLCRPDTSGSTPFEIVELYVQE